MKPSNKRAINAGIPMIMLFLILIATTGIAYTWMKRMQETAQVQAGVQVAYITKSMAANVRIISINATKDGLVIENLGDTNITTVTIWLNGVLTEINLDLENQISPNAYGLIPLNASAAGQEKVEIKLLAVDSESTAFTTQRTFNFREAYEVDIQNVTCLPCNQVPVGCNVTIVDLYAPYNGTVYCTVNQTADPLDCHMYAEIPVVNNVSTSSCEAECGPSPYCEPF